MYLPVDLFTPLLYVAGAGILFLFAIPLGISAFFRWRKFNADADGLQTYVRRRDLRIQTGVSIGCLVLTIAALVTSLIGWQQSIGNLVTNIETKYAVQDVKVTGWNGTWAQVDLVSDDGTIHTNLSVSINDIDEPLLEGNLGGAASGSAEDLQIALR